MEEKNTKKRVLIFSTAYHPSVGGAEIAVKEITDRLPNYSFDLLTINLTGNAAAEEDIGNVHIYRVGRGAIGKFLFPLYGFLKALRLHKDDPYDFVWSIMASQASVAAAFFRMQKKIPLLLTLQEGDEEEHLARYVGGNKFLYKLLIQPWHHLVFKKADRITAISNYLKNRAQQIVSKTAIDVVHNGVDIAHFGKPASPEQISEIRRTANAKQSETLLITVSRLVEKNAVDDSITALSKLPETVKLLVAGSGELEEKLKDLAQKLGVSNRVTFGGYIAHEALPAYFQASDIFVRPSRSEGFGNAFVEAMAAGIPVVATLSGGISDFLQDRVTGMVCEVNNPESLARAVTELIESLELKNAIVASAKAMVDREYGWDSIAESMGRVFASL